MLVTLSNTARGPRGAHALGALVMLNPGETRTVEMTATEADNAHETDGLTVGAAPGADEPAPGADETDLARRSIDDLTALAAECGVALPTTGSGANGRVLKADIVAAIEAGPAAVDDGLADMGDDDLRATVEALTGEAPPADADRAALIALARGD